MKKLLEIFLVIILATSCVIPCYAASKENKRIVRVGWFYSDGVHTFDSNGKPSGYDYDYLQAISQYTNWEYEYVVGTWSECYDWLKTGKIDLMGVVNKTDEREKYFDYSYTAAGTEMCCLFVNSDNKHFAYQDFDNFNGMVIAIEKGAYQINILNEYAKANNFTFTTIEYPTLAEAQNSVAHGNANALLSSNTDVISGYKAIAQFNPVPFYFATTKGNSQLLNELNYAINELFTYYPNFSNDLYSQYYSNNTSSQIVFTSEELNYINSNPTVKVLFDPIWYPIESYDKKNKNYVGIVPDLLQLISQKSGIKFIYEDGGNSVDVLKEFKDSNENIITSISYDYTWAEENNVNITQPFIDSSIMCVTKDKAKPKSVALVEVDYISKMIEKLLPDLKVTYFDSMSKCIEAVQNGKVDCAYLNNCEAEYYMTMTKYSGLNFYTTDLFRQKLCLGISKNADPLLFSIISKCLQNIPNSEIQNMIYENSYHVAPFTIESFSRSNPNIIIFISLTFIFVIIISAILIIRNQIKNNYKISIENQRYKQLADMTNEHIYEYCYSTDVLSFVNDRINIFNGETIIYNYSKLVEKYICEVDNIEDTLYSCFVEKKDLTKEINMLHLDNSKCWYRVTTKIIRDIDNQAIYAIGKIQDVQAEHEERENLIDRARRDGMTGLYNAKAFSELVEDNICKGSALLVVDIDYFKRINDQHGHYNGDKVIVCVSKILIKLFKEIGIIGRVGGDEFAVLIQEIQDKQQIENLCHMLIKHVSKIRVVSNMNEITLSIGVSFANSKESYVQLYKRSDKLLYEIKQNGRNGFKIS